MHGPACPAAGKLQAGDPPHVKGARFRSHRFAKAVAALDVGRGGRGWAAAGQPGHTSRWN